MFHIFHQHHRRPAFYLSYLLPLWLFIPYRTNHNRSFHLNRPRRCEHTSSPTIKELVILHLRNDMDGCVERCALFFSVFSVFVEKSCAGAKICEEGRTVLIVELWGKPGAANVSRPSMDDNRWFEDWFGL